MPVACMVGAQLDSRKSPPNERDGRICGVDSAAYREVKAFTQAGNSYKAARSYRKKIALSLSILSAQALLIIHVRATIGHRCRDSQF